MYTCTITDFGLEYSSDSISKIANNLYNYITENYGSHTVTKVSTNAVYKDCRFITSTGEYIIKTKHEEV